jgi:hypothetical protein
MRKSELSKRITTSLTDEQLSKIEEENIRFANKIGHYLNAEDPGLIVQIHNHEHLHIALGLVSSPIPAGTNANESMKHFQDWIIAQVLAVPEVNADNQEPQNSRSLAFHHLSNERANRIAYGQWRFPVAWQISMAAHPELTMPIFIRMCGNGEGRVHLFEATGVFR